MFIVDGSEEDFDQQYCKRFVTNLDNNDEKQQ